VRFLIPILLLLFVGCANHPTIREVILTDLDDSAVYIKPSENALTVIYFLSPECPLCINYTLAMREMEQEFASDSIKFYGVHSKEWFSANEVKEFAIKYELGFEMLRDSGNQLADALGATITPEVFVLNSDREVLYSGKIDNWVNDLGKKKLQVSEDYLKNALLAWREGKAIEPKRTEPKGCLIE
jgi:peroxiredoxin